MTAQGEDVARLIEEALRATEGMTQQEAGNAIGVAQATISNWRAGQRGASIKSRRAIKRFLNRTKGQMNRVREVPPIFPATDEQQWITARILALGPPGENTRRKLRVVEKYQELLLAGGDSAPGWVFELMERVERGEV